MTKAIKFKQALKTGFEVKNLALRLCLLVLIALLAVRLESEYYWLILEDVYLMGLGLNRDILKATVISLGALLLIAVLVFVFVRRKKLYDFS